MDGMQNNIQIIHNTGFVTILDFQNYVYERDFFKNDFDNLGVALVVWNRAPTDD